VPPRVLVVDDDRKVFALRNFLKGQGYRVSVAGTFTEGVAMARREKFDCVLLDLLLPDTAGANDTLERSRVFAPVPVVAYTGVDDPDLVTKARECGAVNVLLKGSGANTILEKIQLAIAWENPDEQVRRRSAEAAIENRQNNYQPLSKHMSWLTTHRMVGAMLLTALVHMGMTVLYVYKKGGADALFRKQVEDTAAVAADAKSEIELKIAPRLQKLEQDDEEARQERDRLNTRMNGVGSDLSSLQKDMNNGFTRTQESIGQVQTHTQESLTQIYRLLIDNSREKK